MSMALTRDEIERVRHYLDNEREEARRAAQQTKLSFLGWLGQVALDHIIVKIISWRWAAIRSAFGF
jgi:hypothetical protein